ncbi:hypothetical protein GN956_G6382 [Arapaima gigas]
METEAHGNCSGTSRWGGGRDRTADDQPKELSYGWRKSSCEATLLRRVSQVTAEEELQNRLDWKPTVCSAAPALACQMPCSLEDEGAQKPTFPSMHRSRVANSAVILQRTVLSHLSKAFCGSP